jgi:guanosine-3',5'-bis(diphosphate) 3'-pyrophosphohydrolase
MDQDLEVLKQKVASYLPAADLQVIDAAFDFARHAHNGQYRKSGEEYIRHPLAVASILADLGLDVATIVAGILHDTVEDTHVTLADLEAQFGHEVASLVDGVTKLEKVDFSSKEEAQLESLRKMFLAMAKDLRVVLIKLADRLHNMRTLKHQREEKQKLIAQETLEIYAPLAHRLGISEVKWELEDLSLRYMDPERYQQVAQMVARKREERNQLVRQLMDQLRDRLNELGIQADISGRPKHFYSIHKKLLRNGNDITQIYDLIAVRVIVDEVKDCYGVLGAIHSYWRPLPGRFKDYIATPKPNMYQSLHTTVIGPHGEPFEIQIRTWEMHRTSEHGIAAHWRYKDGKTDKDFDSKLSWLRSLLEWQAEFRDAKEFVESVKVDIFADQVFVFTPKGKVIDLPAQATPIDFAFAIHSDVGYRCVGAKVNGKIAPLDSTLKNGDIVEILTSKNSPGPSVDWLKIVKTSGAKNKIRQFFKRERREENLNKGEELLKHEIKKSGLEPHELMKSEWVEEAVRRANMQSLDEMLVAIGVGTLSAATVVSRLRELYEREKRENEPPTPKLENREWEGYGKPSQGVRIKGVDNLLIRFSRCCNPVPGDPIIGYITRGRGVAVHRINCPNMEQFAREPDRLIEVVWAENYKAAHPVEVQISAIDRAGLVADVAGAIADTHLSMLSISAKKLKNKMATVDLVLEVKDVSQLDFVLSKLRRIKDVIHVERVVRERAAARPGAGH